MQLSKFLNYIILFSFIFGWIWSSYTLYAATITSEKKKESNNSNKKTSNDSTKKPAPRILKKKASDGSTKKPATKIFKKKTSDDSIKRPAAWDKNNKIELIDIINTVKASNEDLLKFKDLIKNIISEEKVLTNKEWEYYLGSTFDKNVHEKKINKEDIKKMKEKIKKVIDKEFEVKGIFVDKKWDILSWLNINLYSLHRDKKVESQITDSNGIVSFNLKRWKYLVNITKKWYPLYKEIEFVVNSDIDKKVIINTEKMKTQILWKVMCGSKRAKKAHIYAIEDKTWKIVHINTLDRGSYKLYVKKGLRTLGGIVECDSVEYTLEDSSLEVTKSMRHDIKAMEQGTRELALMEWFLVEPEDVNISVSFWVPKWKNLKKVVWFINMKEINSNYEKNYVVRWINTTQFKLKKWVYNTRVYLKWVWEIYNKKNIEISEDSKIEIQVEWKNKPVIVSWIVSDESELMQDAYILLQNKFTRQSVWTNSDEYWEFEIEVKPWKYLVIIKKNWYNDIIKPIEVWDEWYTPSQPIILTPVSFNDIKISWTVISNDNDVVPNAFLNIIWKNELGDKIWLGNITDDDWYFEFSVSSEYNWKIIVKADWYKRKLLSLGDLHWDYNKKIKLTHLGKTKKAILSVIRSGGSKNIIRKESNFKINISKGSIGEGTWMSYLSTKETTSIPEIPWSNTIGDMAIDITLVSEDGSSITQLNDDIVIDLTYSWAQLVETYSWLTIANLNNLQINYFDTILQTWVPLSTIVTVEDFDLTMYDDDSLLKNIENYETLQINLKTTTNHLTLFTSIVSTVVENTETDDVTSWLTETILQLSSYFENMSQSIKLVAWKDLNKVLKIKRDGETIYITDLLSDASDTISNIWENAVNFAVWDILQTATDWSISISLDGYTTMDITPWSTLKLAEAWVWYLTYETVQGAVKYRFNSRDKWEFLYKVKWKTSYATIRGTTLIMYSDEDKDMYQLEKWNIDVYNSEQDKTVNMNPWDKYIVYTDGTDKLTKWSSDTDNDTDNNTDNTTNTISQIAELLHSKWITNLTHNNTPYDSNLNRAETALLIQRFATKLLNKKTTKENCTFDDISNYPTNTQNEILNACKIWLYKWANNKFLPTNISTKAEIVIVFARLLNNDATMELNDAYDYMLDNEILTIDDRGQAFVPLARKGIYDMMSKAMP